MVPLPVSPPDSESGPADPERPLSRSDAVGRRRAFTRLRLSERRAILQTSDLISSALALVVATLPTGLWEAPGNSPVWVWFLSLWVVDLVVDQASDANDLRRASNAYHGSYVSIRAWIVAALIYLALPYVSAPLLHSRATVTIFIVAG